MNPRKTSIIVGVFILTAYSMLIKEINDSKAVVLITDLLSGLSVIGIAALMCPFFKKYLKVASASYLSLKILEGSLMIIGGILFLFEPSQHLREVIYGNIHTYVFIISAFLFYYLLFISKMVPRFLSVWGGIAIFSLLVITVLRLFDMSNPALESLLILIITNELVLSLWLMFKGFNQSVVKTA
jgi:hypothetical protein